MKSSKIIIFSLLLISLEAKEFYYEYGKKIEVTKLFQKRGLNSISFYQTSNGEKVGVKNEIIVKCKDEVCLKLFKKLNLTDIEKVGNFYLIKLKKNQNIFKISQKLYEDNSTILAHPNFIKEIKKR